MATWSGKSIRPNLVDFWIFLRKSKRRSEVIKGDYIWYHGGIYRVAEVYWTNDQFFACKITNLWTRITTTGLLREPRRVVRERKE